MHEKAQPRGTANQTTAGLTGVVRTKQKEKHQAQPDLHLHRLLLPHHVASAVKIRDALLWMYHPTKQTEC